MRTKHNIKLLYGTGMRIKECLRLRVKDVDLSTGYADVELPDAIDRKYPRAAKEWAWQYIFAAPTYSTDPRTGSYRRVTDRRHPAAPPSPAETATAASSPQHRFGVRHRRRPQGRRYQIQRRRWFHQAGRRGREGRAA